jgi:hypothetical protein
LNAWVVDVAFQEFHRLDEGALIDDHHEADGVEVLLTTEAAAQIGFWIDGAVELRAERTEESEIALGQLRRPLEHVFNQRSDVDVVAERAQ